MELPSLRIGGAHDDVNVSHFLSPLLNTPAFNDIHFFLLPSRDAMVSHSADCTQTLFSTRPPRARSGSARSRWSHLQSHPSRTMEMGKAQLHFSTCSSAEDQQQSQCRCKESPQQVIAHFHELKASGKVRPEAWIILESTNAYMGAAALVNHSDVAISTLQALGGGSAGRRGYNDVTVPHWLVPRGLQRLDPINCGRYTHLAFFKGRRHGSSLLRSETHDNPPSSEYEVRHPGLRARLRKALEGQEGALSRGIVFHSRERQSGYTAAGNAADYSEHMRTSHYCLAPAGNGPWSFRFFEALKVGCIPAVISGGWLLPLSPAVDWRRLTARLPETFEFSDTSALAAALLGQVVGAQGKPPKNVDAALCAQHHAVRTVWDFVKKNEQELWLSAFKVRYLQTVVWRRRISPREELGPQVSMLEAPDRRQLELPADRGMVLRGLSLAPGTLVPNVTCRADQEVHNVDLSHLCASVRDHVGLKRSAREFGFSESTLVFQLGSACTRWARCKKPNFIGNTLGYYFMARAAAAAGGLAFADARPKCAVDTTALQVLPAAVAALPSVYSSEPSYAKAAAVVCQDGPSAVAHKSMAWFPVARQVSTELREALSKWARRTNFPSPKAPLDDVAIHLRCGDVLKRKHREYGMLPLDAIMDRIPADAHSVGIVTMSFKDMCAQCARWMGRTGLRPHTCPGEFMGKLCACSCAELVQMLADGIRRKRPGLLVRVHDKDRLLGAWARLALAPRATICNPSSFCMWPTLAAASAPSAIGHFVASPLWPNATALEALMPNFRVVREPPFAHFALLRRHNGRERPGWTGNCTATPEAMRKWWSTFVEPTVLARG
jgi:hypothetical protein